MSFFAILFKIIPYLMPFIKEMLIGKKSWRQAFNENRGKTILAVTVIVSVTLNVILITKVGILAFKYLELSRSEQELEMKYRSNNSNSGSAKPPPNTTAVAFKNSENESKPIQVVKNSPVIKSESDLAKEVSAEFERIRQREAAAEH